MSLEALTLRTCITRPNVRMIFFHVLSFLLTTPEAKKDDNPEEALKEFRTIVDQETEQGDW